MSYVKFVLLIALTFSSHSLRAHTCHALGEPARLLAIKYRPLEGIRQLVTFFITHTKSQVEGQPASGFKIETSFPIAPALFQITQGILLSAAKHERSISLSALTIDAEGSQMFKVLLLDSEGPLDVVDVLSGIRSVQVR